MEHAVAIVEVMHAKARSVEQDVEGKLLFGAAGLGGSRACVDDGPPNGEALTGRGQPAGGWCSLLSRHSRRAGRRIERAFAPAAGKTERDNEGADAGRGAETGRAGASADP